MAYTAKFLCQFPYVSRLTATIDSFEYYEDAFVCHPV